MNVSVCDQLTKESVQNIIASNGKTKERLLPILLEIQEASGRNYVAEEWAKIVADELDMPLTKVYDVLTFYAMYSTQPRGRYVIEICKSTPCNIVKAKEVVEMFESELGIRMGETTPDELFTLQYTSCVGACDIGPVAKIGDEVYGNLNLAEVKRIIRNYREEAICQK